MDGGGLLVSRLERLLRARPPFRIVLGTASFSRREVMSQLASQHGFTYEVVAADIDEKLIRCAEPSALVRALAHAKADALVPQLRQTAAAADAAAAATLLITCDQVVVHEGRILEKPEGEEEARAMIRGYRRAPARTVGAVVVTPVTSAGSGPRHEELEVCTIHMDPLPEEAVEQLLAEGQVLRCAGGLMVEHPLVAPHITRIEGSQDSVMGLGKEAVMRLLAAAAGV